MKRLNPQELLSELRILLAGQTIRLMEQSEGNTSIYLDWLPVASKYMVKIQEGDQSITTKFNTLEDAVIDFCHMCNGLTT